MPNTDRINTTVGGARIKGTLTRVPTGETVYGKADIHETGSNRYEKTQGYRLVGPAALGGGMIWSQAQASQIANMSAAALKAGYDAQVAAES